MKNTILVNDTKSAYHVIFLIILSFMLAGCASTKLPVTAGMTPQEVKLAWNEPQKITNNKNSCCKKPGEEAWFYFNTKYQKEKPAKYVFFKDGVVRDVFVW